MRKETGCRLVTVRFPIEDIGYAYPDFARNFPLKQSTIQPYHPEMVT